MEHYGALHFGSCAWLDAAWRDLVQNQFFILSREISFSGRHLACGWGGAHLHEWMKSRCLALGGRARHNEWSLNSRARAAANAKRIDTSREQKWAKNVFRSAHAHKLIISLAFCHLGRASERKQISRDERRQTQMSEETFYPIWIITFFIRAPRWYLHKLHQ